MNSEQINRVELQGSIGSIKESNGHIRMSVATSHVYHVADVCVCDTMWHEVVAFTEKVRQALAKGDVVHILGRMARQRYYTQEGIEKDSIYVIASSVEKV